MIKSLSVLGEYIDNKDAIFDLEEIRLSCKQFPESDMARCIVRYIEDHHLNIHKKYWIHKINANETDTIEDYIKSIQKYRGYCVLPVEDSSG